MDDFAMKLLISYTKDDAPFARQLASELRQRGFDVWFAPDDLVGGQHLSEIFLHLQSADGFVVVLSRAALNSRWVTHEVNTALNLYLDGQLKKIVPCVIEELKIPVALSDFLAVSLSVDEPLAGVETLVAALQNEKPPPSRHAEFRNYCEALVPVEARTHGFIMDQWGILQIHREMLQDRINKLNLDPRSSFGDLYSESLEARRPAAVSFEGTLGEAISLKIFYNDVGSHQRSKEGADSQAARPAQFLKCVSDADWSYLMSRRVRGLPFPIMNSWIKMDLGSLLGSRQAMETYLGKAGIETSSIAYVMRGVDEYGSNRTISAEGVDSMKTWSRRSDDELVHLAAMMYAEMKGEVGISLDWIEDRFLSSIGNSSVNDADSCGR